MRNKVINLFSKPKVIQNEGVKYSQLLEQFITPFSKELEDSEFYEDIFDLAIYAWNTANLKSIVPEEDFDNVMNSSEIENSDTDLLLRMIKHKEEQFKNYTNFIVDYELTETIEEPILTVVTQEQDVYLATMLNRIEDENTPDDFEENYINRQAIILKPAQAFIDWYAAFNPDDLDEMKETRTYLVNEDIDDLDQWLKKKFDKLFMFELESFHDNKKEWPQKRNYKMFKEWFHINISTMIYDFENKPVSKF
jgi:hypothetical protein